MNEPIPVLDIERGKNGCINVVTKIIGRNNYFLFDKKFDEWSDYKFGISLIKKFMWLENKKPCKKLKAQRKFLNELYFAQITLKNTFDIFFKNNKTINLKNIINFINKKVPERFKKIKKHEIKITNSFKFDAVYVEVISLKQATVPYLMNNIDKNDCIELTFLKILKQVNSKINNDSIGLEDYINIWVGRLLNEPINSEG